MIDAVMKQGLTNFDPLHLQSVEVNGMRHSCVYTNRVLEGMNKIRGDFQIVKDGSLIRISLCLKSDRPDGAKGEEWQGNDSTCDPNEQTCTLQKCQPSARPNVDIQFTCPESVERDKLEHHPPASFSNHDLGWGSYVLLAFRFATPSGAFFRPSGTLILTGVGARDSTGCRYRTDDGISIIGNFAEKRDDGNGYRNYSSMPLCFFNQAKKQHTECKPAKEVCTLRYCTQSELKGFMPV